MHLVNRGSLLRGRGTTVPMEKPQKVVLFFLKIPSREITQTRKEGTIIASDNLSDL